MCKANAFCTNICLKTKHCEEVIFHSTLNIVNYSNVMMLAAKTGGPTIHSLHYFMQQHVSKLNFSTWTKAQYCESATIVKSVFIFILQTSKAFFKKLDFAIKQPLTIETDSTTGKKSNAPVNKCKVCGGNLFINLDSGMVAKTNKCTQVYEHTGLQLNTNHGIKIPTSPSRKVLIRRIHFALSHLPFGWRCCCTSPS
jgi:hypothetical protein